MAKEYHPQTCVNGCHTGHGPTRQPVTTEGRALICDKCIDRLDTWLREIPDAYTRLGHVIEHGTVPTGPGTTRTKRPDPPAPMRLEIVDLLDTRRGLQYDAANRPLLSDNRRGVFGIILAWSSRLRQERRLRRLCSNCGHVHRHDDRGHPEDRCACGCTTWQITITLGQECALLGKHLAWISEQEWVGELYAELRQLARQLTDAVGDYRDQPSPRPVGWCVALVPKPGLGLEGRFICGGPVYLDDDRRGAYCRDCGDHHTADQLRKLGRAVGIITEEDEDEGEEPEA